MCSDANLRKEVVMTDVAPTQSVSWENGKIIEIVLHYVPRLDGADAEIIEFTEFWQNIRVLAGVASEQASFPSDISGRISPSGIQGKETCFDQLYARQNQLVTRSLIKEIIEIITFGMNDDGKISQSYAASLNYLISWFYQRLGWRFSVVLT